VNYLYGKGSQKGSTKKVGGKQSSNASGHLFSAARNSRRNASQKKKKQDIIAVKNEREGMGG